MPCNVAVAIGESAGWTMLSGKARTHLRRHHSIRRIRCDEDTLIENIRSLTKVDMTIPRYLDTYLPTYLRV